MHPAVHATTRTPGPSTVAPVVNEWRNPMSPLATAARTSGSGMPALRLRRSSYGLFAVSGVSGPLCVSGMAATSVERPVDHVHLPLARQADEVHGVAGHADGEAGVFLRMLHGFEQRVAVEHVDVHVIPGAAEVGVEHRDQIDDAILRHA